MFSIATALWTGADAHIYLNTWAPYPGDLKETCSTMLNDYFGISSEWVNWYLDFESDSFWLRDFGPLFVRDVVDANPQVDEATVRALFKKQLGCEELVIVKALNDHATGHVDMWMAWADHNTLLVGEYQPLQDAVNRAIIENNVKKKLKGLRNPVTGDPIEIVRVPMPSNCPAETLPGKRPGTELPPLASQWCAHVPRGERIWRSYLNVLFINNILMLPTYAQDRSYEDEAIAIWESFGFDVIPLDADLIAPSQGEFHCVAKTLDAAR